MSSVIIRPLEAADGEAVRAVSIAANEEFRSAMGASVYGAYIGNVLQLEARRRSATVLVAEVQGTVVGTVTLYRDVNDEGMPPRFPPGTAGIRATAVTPAARGQGVGSRLVETAIQIARSDGARAIALHTADCMRAAESLYRRHGFVRAPRYDYVANEFFGSREGPPLAALAFVLTLRRVAATARRDSAAPRVAADLAGHSRSRASRSRAVRLRPLVLGITLASAVGCGGSGPAGSAPGDSARISTPASGVPATASPDAIAASATPGVSPSAPATSSLDGDWRTDRVTCKQRERAASRAGFTHRDLVLAGFYDDCRTSAIAIRMKEGRLFFLAEDGSVDFSTTMRVIDETKFQIDDMSGGNLVVTFIRSGDELTIQRVAADRSAQPGSDLFADLVATTASWLSSPFHRQTPEPSDPSPSGPVVFVSARYPISFALPPGWSIEANADEAYFVSADNAITLSLGTGSPRAGDTVADRVGMIQAALYKGCRFDSHADVSTSVGGEEAIIWPAECEGEARLSLNTIHDRTGYLLALRAPGSRAAELKSVMDEVTSTLAYTD